ncbi:glycosyltransferase family 39 protein [Lacinutrix jangbogonensis]|uniref:glycosyltransferase family 39 protein n=1 Tax=Lacinutrix jangbogonensis TaxID=1469557 RepID=UPI00053EA4D2|nr:glycosyltransferase family 39 protein [Lacinutrix jangbogonensis]
MKGFLKKYQDPFAVILLWLLIIIIINPIGDFPLNDDWCYGKTVKTLYEDGYLKLYNWGEMTLVGHVYYGYLFTKIFGFSFTVLRYSTLLLAVLSSIGLLKIFRVIELPKTLGLFGVLLCVFNPVFLELSFTYMTDIPFYTLSVFVYYFFIKHIKTKVSKYLFFAFMFCVLAYTIRQLAIVYPLSFMLYSIAVGPFKLRPILKSILPFLLFFIFALLFDFTLSYFEISQERYNSKFYLLLNKLFHFNKSQLIYSTCLTLTSLAYLGFFLSPVLFFRLKTLPKNYIRIFVPIYTITSFYILYSYNYILPSLDNIWIDFGVGPFTLYYEDAHFTQTPKPLVSAYLYYILTLVGVIASSVILHDIYKTIRNLKQKVESNSIQTFTLVFAIVYVFPFLLVGVYDRYLLILYPLTIVFVLNNFKQNINTKNKIYAVPFLGLLMWFSVSATHDYLSWNRARWEVLNTLIDKGVPTHKIYGGVEFITWYHYSDENKRFWEEVKPVYALVANKTINYNIVQTIKYSRWLPGKGELYLIYNKHLDH